MQIRTWLLRRTFDRSSWFLVAILAIFLSAPSARAAVIVTITEDVGFVSVSGAGTLDTTAFGSFFVMGMLGPSGINNDTDMAVGPMASLTFYDSPSNFSGPLTLGGAGTSWTGSSSGTGDIFGINFSEILYVPTGYTSGSPLSGTALYSGQSLASLGISPGTYTWNWGSGGNADSFTVDIVPEPNTAVLLGCGLVWLAARRRLI